MGLGKTYSTKYLLDSNNNSGVAGQVLSTTSTGIDWVDANTVPGTGLWLANGNDIYNSNSGDVVVGGTSSNYKFGVTGGHIGVSNGGNIYVGGFGADAVIGYLGNTSGVFTLKSDGSRDISIGSDTEAIFIEGSNGKVGIGTNSPVKQLVVRGSAPWIRLEEDSASSKRLDLWVDPTSAIGYIGANQSAQQLSFQTASSDRIRILNNGNVGINKTSPDFKLDVDGTFGVSDLPFNSTSISVLVANETIGAEIITNGNFNTDLTDWTNSSSFPWTSATWTASGVRLQTSSSAQYKSFFQNIGTITSGKTYKISYSLVKTTGTIRVGIETAPVGSGLGYNKGFTSSEVVNDVFTATATDTSAVISFWAQNDSSTVDWVIDNVSLKEVTPTNDQIQKREISSDVFTGGPFLPLAGGTMTGNVRLNDNVQLQIGSSNDAYITHNGTNTYFVNGVGNLEITNDTNDGDLIFKCDDGSGGTTPYLTLDGSTTHAYFSNPGNVGIGVTGPTEKLVVAGNVFLSGGGYLTWDGKGSYVTAVPGNAAGYIFSSSRNPNDGSGDFPFNQYGEMIFQGNARSGYNGGFTWVTGQAAYGSTVAPTPKMTLTTAGNVGIGLTNPDGKLHVYTSGVNRVFIESDNNANQVFQSAAGGSGYNQYTFKQMGGTIALPTQLGGGYDIGNIIFQGYDGTDMRPVAGIRIRNSDTITSTSSPGDINFETTTVGSVAVSTKMTILSSGNVGIGVTGPVTKLHVFEAGTAMIRVDSGATSPYKAGIEFLRSSINGGRIYNDGNAVQVKLESDFAYDAANPSRGGFMFKTAPVTSGTLVDAVRIDARGYVGIGTTTPDYKFEVQGIISSADASLQKATFANVGNDLVLTANADATNVTAKILFNSSGAGGGAVSTKMIIDGSGKVGIGTLSPDKDLTVGGINPTHGINLRTKSGTSEWLLWQVEQYFSQEGYMRMFNDNVAKIQFRAGGDSYFVGGDVGIGTTSPNTKLHVTGSTRITNDLYFDATSTSTYKIKQFGVNLQIWGNALVPAIEVLNTGTLKFGTYALGGLGTPTHLLGVTSTGQVVKTTSGSDLPGGPYLPLAGGTLTGALTGTSGSFSASVTASGNSNTFGNTTTAALTATSGTFSASVTAAGNSNSFGATTFTGNVISTDGTDTATLSQTGLTLSRSNSYIQSNADNSDTLNIGQSSVRWGHVKVDGATFKVLNGGNERFGINSSGNATFTGNVGINNTSPGEKLEVTGNIFVSGKFGNLVANTSGVQFEAATGATQTCRFDSDEMRFFAGGGVGEVFTMLNSSGATTFINTVTATNFILSSDERLKENIKTLEPKVISAEWKSFNAKNDDSYRTGVIAQELEKKHPEFVETNDKGFKSVKYIDLLISKIAELEARLEKAGI